MISAHLLLDSEGGQLVEQDVVLGSDCSQAVAEWQEQAVQKAKRIPIFLHWL